MTRKASAHPRAQFPRSAALPAQSPKYWVREKDRYLRQLLIGDIERQTGRSLAVLIAGADQTITASDAEDLAEILSGLATREIDLMLQTPGGDVNATEKMIAVLRKATDGYRVIVPGWAKSAGTVVAISARSIVMGLNSELGPIDPQFSVNGNLLPADILAADHQLPLHLRDHFSNAVKRTRLMAGDLLRRGMLRDAPDRIPAILAKISSSEGYLNHGAVIDSTEAAALGLAVDYLPEEDELWRRIWLLACIYEHDMKATGLGKIFESARYSLGRAA